MRVLMTTDTVGGVWTYSLHLSAALVKRDVEVTLISLGGLPSKTQLNDLCGIAGVDLIPTPFKLEWMKDSDPDVETSKRFVMDVADHVKPDVFHTNQFCFATLRLGVPNVVAAHSDMLSWWSWRFHDGNDSFEVEPFLADYQRKVRRALLAADAVVCPSAFMADNLRRFYDPGLRSVSVIYNGILAPTRLPTRLRKKRMAVSVGRLWDEGKNARCVIEAARMMPNLDFTLVGPTIGPDGNNLDVEPPPNVRLTGRRSPQRVAKVLTEAAVYIGPSLYEPFGLSPLEAALSSCALVMSDIPSFREIWEDSALYFPPKSPEALVEQLRRLVDKPDAICRHATMARFRAHRFYTSEKMAEQYHALYVTLISSARRFAEIQQIPHAY